MTRLFCSDLCILESLYPDGVPSDIEIVSDSIRIHQLYGAASMNDRVSPERLVELTSAIHNICLKLYGKLKDAGYEEDSYAIMYAITCTQNFLKKAALVKAQDFGYQSSPWHLGWWSTNRLRVSVVARSV